MPLPVWMAIITGLGIILDAIEEKEDEKNRM